MKKMKNILNSTSNKKKTQGRFKAILYHGSTIIIKFGHHRKCFRTFHYWTFMGKYVQLLGKSPGFVRTASPPRNVICTKQRVHRRFQYGDSKYLNLNNENSLLAMVISKTIFWPTPSKKTLTRFKKGLTKRHVLKVQYTFPKTINGKISQLDPYQIFYVSHFGGCFFLKNTLDARKFLVNKILYLLDTWIEGRTNGWLSNKSLLKVGYPGSFR